MESIIWNKYSKTITQDVSQPAAQAMLYAIGMTEADMKKAQVGIVSMGWEGNPCNMHLNDLAKVIKQGVQDQPELYGLIFNTIGVSDGISMGTSGMRYSLPSRDLIADSIETVEPLPMQILNRSFRKPARDRVLAVVCTLPIPWLQPLKPWG